MARWLATARPQHPVLAWQESTHSDALDTFEELLGGLDAHDAQRWKAKRADFAARTTLGSLLNDRAEYVVGRALDAYQLGNTKVRNPDFVLPPTAVISASRSPPSRPPAPPAGEPAQPADRNPLRRNPKANRAKVVTRGVTGPARPGA
ncbi:hypothetical protein ACFV30_44260 [Streptomyces sp. NPDC059752]|uniref:hypothetical protein n=1 Tax=Streptomyces sp. NPDC059752 TaxID=3346932 RepID=UPI0036502625